MPGGVQGDAGVARPDAGSGSCRGVVETGQRFTEPMLPRERTREAGQVAGRRLGPPIRIAEMYLEVDEESRQRAHVLVVVTDDLHQLVGNPASQESQVGTGSMPAA